MPPMRGRRSRHVPPPPPRRRFEGGAPKLATIKLDSAWRAPPKVTRQGATMFAAATVLVAGAAVAGAAWLGGSLFDAREAMSQRTDSVLATIGFDAHVVVEGATPGRSAEVLAIAMPEGRESLLAADPRDVQARVESLDWVSNATVRRRWPNELLIEVERRAAFARWQENGQTTVIDTAGERLLAERAADHPELPLVVGAGAGHAAEPLLTALDDLPELRERLVALVRVGERRWNVELRSGATIELPESAPVLALARLEALQTRYDLLDRPVEKFDLRTPGRLSVKQEGAPLLGGPSRFVRGA